jgi:hypothetical protein
MAKPLVALVSLLFLLGCASSNRSRSFASANGCVPPGFEHAPRLVEGATAAPYVRQARRQIWYTGQYDGPAGLIGVNTDASTDLYISKGKVVGVCRTGGDPRLVSFIAKKTRRWTFEPLASGPFILPIHFKISDWRFSSARLMFDQTYYLRITDFGHGSHNPRPMTSPDTFSQ